MEALSADAVKKQTYMEPRRKTPASPNFCFRGSCNLKIGGSGRVKIMMSRRKSDIAIAR